MKQQLLIERYPVLSDIFASSHPFINTFSILASALLCLSIGINSLTVDHLHLYLIAFFGSWFYWTFFEYGFHRWFYHGKYKSKKLKSIIHSFHIYHHLNLEDKRVITAGPVMILVLGAVLILSLIHI